jgi:hypothetical protein
MLESQAKPASTPPAPPPLTDTSNLHPCSTGVKCGVQDGYVYLGSSPCATWTCGDNQCTASTNLPPPSASLLPASWTARLVTPPFGSPSGPLRGPPCLPGPSVAPGGQEAHHGAARGLHGADGLGGVPGPRVWGRAGGAAALSARSGVAGPGSTVGGLDTGLGRSKGVQGWTGVVAGMGTRRWDPGGRCTCVQS